MRLLQAKTRAKAVSAAGKGLASANLTASVMRWRAAASSDAMRAAAPPSWLASVRARRSTGSWCESQSACSPPGANSPVAMRMSVGPVTGSPQRVVAGPAPGDCLEENRALPGPAQRDRLAGRGVHGENVGAIDPHGRDID